MNIIAEFGCNWKNLDLAAFMMGFCSGLNIKHIKFQLWKLNQVPEKVRDMYITPMRALYFVNLARQYQQEVFFTPFYPEAVEICESCQVKYYKVRYADRNDEELMNAIIETGKPVFISCSNPEDTIWWNYSKSYFLYCVPEYPAKYEGYIGAHIDEFDGISDHTKGLKLMKEAEEKGFQWFEKHVYWEKDSYERRWSIHLEELLKK